MTAPTASVDQRAGEMWWMFLVTGVVWFLIAMAVLRFDERSIDTVGVVIGVVFLFVALNDLATATMERSWRFAHILLAIFFGAGAIWAFVQPEEAFWALASVIGFLFALKGSLDIIKGIALRGIDPLWVLMLVVGILEVLLGFWASQQLDPARAQLIFLWVGFGALFRGMGEIILAFRLRSASRAS